MDAVRLAAAVVLLTSACGISVGPDQPWVPIDTATSDLAPEHVAPPSLAAPHDGPIRLVTYNVQYAPDVPAIADVIANNPELASADAIFVQEIESYPDEAGSRASRLAALLQLGYVYVPARLRNGGTHGLAILSRYPLTNVMRMDLPEVSQSIHLRIAVSADIDLGTRTLSVIDLHLDTLLNAGERIAQLHPVVIDAPPQTVVAGDFNMSRIEWLDGVPILSPSASDQAPVVDSYMHGLGFATPCANSGATEHMYGIEQRLDAIYTRDLATTYGGIDRSGPSDHWPMWVDVTP
jgi:endonuclease/exonuclease/phosphatase family metal-dependent hydrolase